MMLESGEGLETTYPVREEDLPLDPTVDLVPDPSTT